jgi:hypothetical protein
VLSRHVWGKRQSCRCRVTTARIAEARHHRVTRPGDKGAVAGTNARPRKMRVPRPALTQTDNYKELTITVIIRVAMRSRTTSGSPVSCSFFKGRTPCNGRRCCRECSTALVGGIANAFTWGASNAREGLAGARSRFLMPRGSSAGPRLCQLTAQRPLCPTTKSL